MIKRRRGGVDQLAGRVMGLPALAEQVRSLRLQGLSYRAIAAELAISRQRVYQLLAPQLRGCLTDGMAACHPHRVIWKKTGRCRLCVQLQAGDDTLQQPPGPVIGVFQYHLVTMPTECPKCGNRLLVLAGRRVACSGNFGGCGWDAYFVGPSVVQQPRRSPDHYGTRRIIDE